MVMPPHELSPEMLDEVRQAIMIWPKHCELLPDECSICNQGRRTLNRG